MPHEQRSPKQAGASVQVKLKRYRIATVVLAVLCLFLLIVTLAQLGTGSASSAASDRASSKSAEPRHDAPGVKREKDDPTAIGDVDAPVVLVEYTDMRCPFCAAFARDTFPSLVKEYVDKGLVRVEVREVAYFGDQSVDAAVAARAAGKQGQYFDFVETLYGAAPESGHPDLPTAKLVKFAEDAKVKDLAAFKKTLDDEGLHSQVLKSTAQAQQAGVNSVPFFTVGDQSFSGAQSLGAFRSVLDQSLTEAGATPPEHKD